MRKHSILKQFVRELPPHIREHQQLQKWMNSSSDKVPPLRLEWCFGELDSHVKVTCTFDFDPMNGVKNRKNEPNLIEIQVITDPRTSVSPSAARCVAEALIEASAWADMVGYGLRYAAKGLFDLEVTP